MTLLIPFIFVSILGTVLPHFANTSPLLSFSFLIGYRLNAFSGALVNTVVYVICTFLLSYLNNYPILGSWTFFSVTGLLMIMMCGHYYSRHENISTLCYFIFCFSLMYWLWTNLGVWLFTSLYPHTVTGFLQCYSAAIPFLGLSILGNFVWTFFFFSFMGKIVSGKVSPLLLAGEGNLFSSTTASMRKV